MSDSNERDPAQENRDTPGANAALLRLILSGVILAVFFGSLLFEYWPDLAAAALRLVNSARTAGAERIESRYFEVHNGSMAGETQVRSVVQALELQYETIAGYVQVQPSEKIPVLLLDGQEPALMDGEQLILYDDNGQIDTSLAPFFLVLLIEELPIDSQGGIVQAGGYALQVVEAAGLGENLTRQPLDHWTALLRQENSYLPLPEAWNQGIPVDEQGTYDLIRAMLESGSFMRWFNRQYGLDAARRLAEGADMLTLTGKSLAENEAEWLRSLDAQEIEPEACEAVIPRGSVFAVLCEKLGAPSH